MPPASSASTFRGTGGVVGSWLSDLNAANEKKQTLTTTNTSYTLGSPTDDWGAHVWAPGDFADNKFRVRIHDVNPGPTCHVDSLQARAYYSVSVDPTTAALNAADAAKIAAYSSLPFTSATARGRSLLAQLASGSTSNGSHQPGSANDLSGSPSTGDTGYKPASSAPSPSQWTNAPRAYASDNSYATDSTANHQQAYGVFKFAVPPSVTINGVEINVEAKSSDASGCQIGAEISTDGGAHFTGSGNRTQGSIGSSDNAYAIGGSNTLWGRSWATTDFTDQKFVVRLQNIHGTGCTGNATLSVDQVRARVYYSVIPENADGDDFFISPTSADMQNIFQTIGAQVCPAIGAPPPAPPPTQGTLIVLTHTVNDNGGGEAIERLPTSVSGTNASVVSPFAGSESPGVSISLDPGAYSADEDTGGFLYSKTRGPGCSGTIHAGDRDHLHDQQRRPPARLDGRQRDSTASQQHQHRLMARGRPIGSMVIEREGSHVV